ncbi:hypothetical protein ACVRW4_08270 [Streptococcus phocae subsp. phocae]
MLLIFLVKVRYKEGIVLKYIDESNEIYNEIDDLICFILNNKNVNEMNRRLGHLKTKLRKLKARVELNASALPLDSRSYKELKRSIEELLKKSSSVSPNVIVNFLLDSQKTLTYINDQLYLSIGLGNRITLRKFKRAIRAWFDSLMELQKKIQSMIKRFFR